MIAVNDNEMSEKSFLGWLQEADYYLKQTGLKDQFRLNREGEEYLVRGLGRRFAKGSSVRKILIRSIGSILLWPISGNV